MDTPEFVGFPKMARLSREVIVTEKIDGTNAQVFITPDGKLYSGSRNRWVTSDDDNYGFGRWCNDHLNELLELGHGHHFGEWWGNGIQRGYGLREKRFSLFNTIRLCLADSEPQLIPSNNPKAEPKFQEKLPECCGLVPVLYRGVFETHAIDDVMQRLSIYGSSASPGFMNPEGVVVYHVAGNVGFKKTLWNDSAKGAV